MSVYAQQAIAGNDLAAPPGGYRYGGGPISGGGGLTGYAGSYSNPVYSQTPVPTGMPTIPTHLIGGSTGSTGGTTGGTGSTTAHTPTPTPTPTGNALSPTSALNAFANSAGMKFAEQQGANVLNNMYAAHGEIQSGAAAKALQSFGQNTALQQYFMPYMQMLQGQQGMGAQAASAVAGVGSNYGNTVANINSGMGNALATGAMNIGNANANQALINGYGNSQVGAAIGSGLGQIGSSFFTPSTSAAPSYAPFNSTIAYNNGAMGVSQPYVG